LNNLEVLIDGVFHKVEDMEWHDVWIDMMDSYRMAMEILQKQREYTDDKINQFQYLIDDFFEK
jgi:hypothetical protein